MAQFLVCAHDVSAPDGPARRTEKQPEHRAMLKTLRDKGNLLLAGPLTDDAGATIGSVMVMEFPDRKNLDAWLSVEPYMAGKVWARVAVTPMRVTVPAPNP